MLHKGSLHHGFSAGLIWYPWRSPSSRLSASCGAVPEHKVLVSEALGHKVKGVGAKLALLAALLDLLTRSGIPDKLLQLGLPLCLELPVLCYALRLLRPACDDSAQPQTFSLNCSTSSHRLCRDSMADGFSFARTEAMLSVVSHIVKP